MGRKPARVWTAKGRLTRLREGHHPLIGQPMSVYFARRESRAVCLPSAFRPKQQDSSYTPAN
eukprot:7584843-Pyramimonas_sp.AAC.1